MTGVAGAGVAAGVGLGLFWVVSLLRFHRAGRDFPELDSRTHPGPLEAAPLISVIVSCKDEGANVEACVRSILAQDYPALQLVVADDRSSDGTPEVLAALQEEFAQLRVVTVETLPAGWGGQNHGLHRGVQAASGEWLCFTDADCRFDTACTISTAFKEAQAHGVEFLSILPRMEAPSLWERVYLPLCGFVFLRGLDVTDTNDPQRPGASAYGPFMLIAREAYARIGGHPRVATRINGDVDLARIAKREGVRLRLVGNTDLCRTRMYASVGAAWRGWARNFYNSIQRPAKLVTVALTSLTLFVLPWLGFLLAGGLALVDPATWPVAFTWGAVVLVSHLGLWRLYRAFAIPPGWSLLYLPGALFTTAIGARAALSALLATGTTWHGVHYPHPRGSPRWDSLQERVG